MGWQHPGIGSARAQLQGIVHHEMKETSIHSWKTGVKKFFRTTGLRLRWSIFFARWTLQCLISRLVYVERDFVSMEAKLVFILFSSTVVGSSSSRSEVARTAGGRSVLADDS
jgi:hypothetical protein